MVEFYNLVKQVEEERKTLENILASSITQLEKAGLNTDKFENTIYYYDSFNEDEEGVNHYAYIQRMIASHNIEHMVEKKESPHIWDFNRIKKLIEDWVNSLSVKEILTDTEIENEIEESKKYFLEVIKDYDLTDTDKDYFTASFNDDIKIINKLGRQERREHGESIVDKNWLISSINIIAELDFENKISDLADEGYLDEDNPIFDIYEKYKKLTNDNGAEMKHPIEKNSLTENEIFQAKAIVDMYKFTLEEVIENFKTILIFQYPEDAISHYIKQSDTLTYNDVTEDFFFEQKLFDIYKETYIGYINLEYFKDTLKQTSK